VVSLSKLDGYYKEKVKRAEKEDVRRKVIQEIRDEKIWVGIRNIVLEIIQHMLIAAESSRPKAIRIHCGYSVIDPLYYIIWWSDYGGKLKLKTFDSFAWKMKDINKTICLTTAGLLFNYEYHHGSEWGDSTSIDYIDLCDKKHNDRYGSHYINQSRYSGNPQNMRGLCQELLDGAIIFGISEKMIDNWQRKLHSIN